jgi:deazaflavin-dependent oxidoreductase (nitroreductase family)
VPRPGKLLQRILSSDTLVAAEKRVVPPADLRLYRLTRGRFSLTGMGGMPILLLTTTTRSSGEPRVAPLIYVGDRDAYHVVGSNWGGPRHPGWALNLLAQPTAVVEVRGERRTVAARLLAGPEREAAWSRFIRLWPPYANYARTAGRELPVFELRPVQ